MGRETKLLLGFLATLLGVFLGVLSMKLLVPRPPAGTGPDIHADVAATEPQELVEPPRFDEPPPSREPLADTVVEPPPQAPPAAGRFEPAAVARDPFVTRSSFTPAAPPTADPVSAPPEPPTAFGASRLDEARGSPARMAASGPPPVAGSAYVAREGDSWWSLAESVYGDGRLYRALFAWNRTVDPRVSLVPGTSLELPPLQRLQTAWPALMPAP